VCLGVKANEAPHICDIVTKWKWFPGAHWLGHGSVQTQTGRGTRSSTQSTTWNKCFLQILNWMVSSIARLLLFLVLLRITFWFVTHSTEQLVKKLPYYGTWSFSTVFTRARHWTLSWVTRIRSTLFNYFLLPSNSDYEENGCLTSEFLLTTTKIFQSTDRAIDTPTVVGYLRTDLRSMFVCFYLTVH
jgi:hypothetical protein